MRARSLLAGLLLALGLIVLPVAAGAQEEETTAKRSHASQECLEILEKGGEPDDCVEAPSPILPATNEIVWGGISFFLLLFLMWKFAYPGIKAGMEGRTQRIRDSLDEAERAKSDAQRVLDDYQRQLADAKNESSRIIEEARQTAEQMRRDLLTRAEAEAAELRQRSQQEITAARDRAIADIRAQVSELAVGAAEVVVQRSLDRETNIALVEQYIQQVGQGAGG